jgi:hypothetical protein
MKKARPAELGLSGVAAVVVFSSPQMAGAADLDWLAHDRDTPAVELTDGILAATAGESKMDASPGELESLGPELTEQAVEPLRVSMCKGACSAAHALGCGAITLGCTGTTVITIGGTTIPCLWAALAACSTGLIGVAICQNQMCPRLASGG